MCIVQEYGDWRQYVLAFPRETDEQIRRMVLAICQDHIRKILDSVRELTNMVHDFTAGTSLKVMEDHLVNIRRFKDEASEQRQVLLGELAESGALLVSREDILRLVVQTNEIADHSESAAFWFNYMASKKLEIIEAVQALLLNMAKNVLKAVTNLRETIFSLTYNRTRAIELAMNVELAEYTVDELYRETEMKIIESKMGLSTILVLRRTAASLEDMADKAEDAIDSVRILALGI